MVIKQIKKNKKNTYEITFQSGIKSVVFEDLIVKYRLLPNKEISNSDWKNIINENDTLSSYYLAIQYLTIRLRTKKELRQYLRKKQVDNTLIEETIKKLEQEGYLKEEEYIRCFFHDSFRFSSDGPLKIKKKLLDHGLQEEKIEAVKSEISLSDWLFKLEKIFQKKANSHHTDGLEKWKQKCIQYLIQLGYPKEWIMDILPKIEWMKDNSIINKEYEKIKRKLSRKYEGNELEFQIKHRLYLKGFQKEEIDAIKKERE